MTDRRLLLVVGATALVSVAVTAAVVGSSHSSTVASKQAGPTATPSTSPTAPAASSPPTPTPGATATGDDVGPLSDDVPGLQRGSTDTSSNPQAMAERSVEWLLTYDTSTDASDQAYKASMAKFGDGKPSTLAFADNFHLSGEPWNRAALVHQRAFVDHLTAYQPDSLKAQTAGTDQTAWTVTAMVHTRYDGGGTDTSQQVSILIQCDGTCRLDVVGTQLVK